MNILEKEKYIGKYIIEEAVVLIKDIKFKNDYEPLQSFIVLEVQPVAMYGPNITVMRKPHNLVLDSLYFKEVVKIYDTYEEAALILELSL